MLPSSPDGRGGGMQKAGMLRVDLVPIWLSGVRIQAVKEEIRPKLERFQREAAKVLWEAFQEGHLTADPALFGFAVARFKMRRRERAWAWVGIG